MKTAGKHWTGILISAALILAGGYLISQASREYVKAVPEVLYSFGSEEQNIAKANSAGAETRVVTETNYFYLAAGIGMIVFTGGYWLYRFVKSKERGVRRKRF